MKKYMITGGTGFIGIWLVKELLEIGGGRNLYISSQRGGSTLFLHI